MELSAASWYSAQRIAFDLHGEKLKGQYTILQFGKAGRAGCFSGQKINKPIVICK
jgi:hypothetical protein